MLPNANFGPLISAKNQGYRTTAGWVKAIYDSRYDAIASVPAQYYVNVQDNARLHVIALTDPEVQGERIFAFTAPFNCNDIVGILRKIRPNKHWDDVPNQGLDLSEVPAIRRAEELLRADYGVGLTGLEESVKANIEGLYG